MKPARYRRYLPWAILGLLVLPGILLAIFTNGGFESGDFTDWTKTTYINPSLSGTPPFTTANIVRNAGGSDQSVTVTAAAPETGVDPRLGATATLKFPKFGVFSARINGPTTGRISNTITQQSTTTAADVDPVDNLIHVRFTYAPVMENPQHSPEDQPYFAVILRNVTKSTVLFETLNFSNQPGVPWKPSPLNPSVLYTDWQIVDIAPPLTALAIGDTIEIEVIGADCALGGHYGYVYADAFGAQIPGLSVTKAASPDPVSLGANLTYTFTYRNTGSTTVTGVIVKETIPADTTFVSVSDPNCSHAAGVVTCNFSSLAPGALGNFNVVVAVSATATGSISNGNYTIEGVGLPPTLGPLIQTTIGGIGGSGAAEIPTLSEWALAALAVALAAIGVLVLRRM
jgi:uncharacterized repeat protein (TIGR01451 family)